MRKQVTSGRHDGAKQTPRPARRDPTSYGTVPGPTITLKDSAGKPLSGLVPPAGAGATGETAFDGDGHALPPEPDGGKNGLDDYLKAGSAVSRSFGPTCIVTAGSRGAYAVTSDDAQTHATARPIPLSPPEIMATRPANFDLRSEVSGHASGSGFIFDSKPG